MTNKFKPDDRVVRTAPYSSGGVNEGDIVTVAYYHSTRLFTIKEDKQGGLNSRKYKHSDSNYSLVSEKNDKEPLTVERALNFLKSQGEVKFVPKWEPVRITLNAKYTALVHEGYVEVGCQKFYFNVVEDLYDAVKLARKHAKQVE